MGYKTLGVDIEMLMRKGHSQIKSEFNIHECINNISAHIISTSSSLYKYITEFISHSFKRNDNFLEKNIMNGDLIQISGFPSVKRKQVARYLQYDIDDDWFQDPIRYADYIKMKKELEYFITNSKKNRGIYLPAKSELFVVPKSNFTVRYSLETDYYERWLYFYLVIPMIKKFDSLLPRQVYNHRYNSYDDRYIFFNRVYQWTKFEGIVRSQLRHNNKVLIEADIQNYFENIYIEYLAKDLNECMKETTELTDEIKELSKSITCIINCLKSWSCDGIRGIPQNRDCSSFLANIYMVNIDRIMLEAGFEYYRYMDDIRIICDDIFQARKALLLLSNSLRGKMLSLNSKKTKIIEPNTEEFRVLIKPDFQLQSIDLLLRTKKKANVAIGFSILRDLLISIIEEKSFDTKAFRFCITRISKLARCKDYKLPYHYFYNIIDGIIDSLIVCPTSTDIAFEFLSSVRLQEQHIKRIINYLENKEQAIYEWQNYWLWKLLIVHEIKEESLLELSINIIDNIKRNSVDKAGAILYIAKYGEKSHLLHIRDIFPSINSILLQRHSLFALKKLNWKKDIQEITESIDHRLIGNYKEIRNNIRDIVLKPPPVSITEILESVHQYD